MRKTRGDTNTVCYNILEKNLTMSRATHQQGINVSGTIYDVPYRVFHENMQIYEGPHFNPPRAHIIYLVDRVHELLNEFADNARDPSLSGVAMTADEILTMQNDEMSAFDEKTPEEFILCILHTALSLSDFARGFQDNRRKYAYAITGRMMQLYCLAFYDMCYQVKEGKRLIDTRISPFLQLMILNHTSHTQSHHVVKYPRLSSWITQTLADWHEGMDEMLGWNRSHHTQFGENIINFMTVLSREDEDDW